MNDPLHDPANGAAARPRILHVSADFPDPIAPDKTTAIRSLLELTRDDFRHRVISINRRPPGGMGGLFPRADKAATFADFEWGECLTYSAPGRGLFHRGHLLRLAEAIAERLRDAPLPDLIVGHKLTVEGIVVQRLSELIGVPFTITIQGNTDAKIVAARPDLAPRFRSILRETRGVTAFAPWSIEALEARLGTIASPVTLIPCPTELDAPLAPQAGGNGLLSVFHLHGHANKNLAGMARALRILAKAGEGQALAICGGGSEADLAAARRSAGDAPGLTFEGPLAREAVAVRMNSATAFVLPSRRESFGLVFIEALFAGLPIIYPRGMAVSGWFDNCPFAIPVPPRDPAAIADAMAFAVREETRLKAALLDWQVSRAAERFRRPGIAAAYGAALQAACGVQDERAA